MIPAVAPVVLGPKGTKIIIHACKVEGIEIQAVINVCQKLSVIVEVALRSSGELVI